MLCLAGKATAVLMAEGWERGASLASAVGNRHSGPPGRGAGISNGRRQNAPFAPELRDHWFVLTIFGVASLTFMMIMYALEHRGRAFVVAFALGCGLSSAYGFLSGAWPFGVVEGIWVLVALRRISRLSPRHRAA